MKTDKGVRDEPKRKEGGRSARWWLSSRAGEAAALSHDSGKLRRWTSGAAVEEEGWGSSVGVASGRKWSRKGDHRRCTNGL
jgi:hypothetical protein